MTPAVAISLASILLTIAVQSVMVAYFAGKLAARVTNLEGRPTADGLDSDMAIVTTRLDAMERTLQEVSHDVKNILTGRVIPASRSGRDGA